MYEAFGSPADLQLPVVTVAHVVNFSERTRKRTVEFGVHGHFSQADIELARQIHIRVRRALENVENAKVDVLCHASIGNPLGVIKDASKVFEEGDVDISHTEGQVILLIFWASWCNHCKTAIRNTHGMVAANKKKWGERVRVIGLGIDTDRSKQVQFLTSPRMLTAFEHFNVKNAKSRAIQYFGLQRVPTAALVNTEGKIVFIGHPNQRRLDDDINKLLTNRALEGEGTKSDAVEEAAQWASNKLVPGNEIEPNVDRF